MLNKYGLLMIGAAFVNAVSQVLLKKSADETADRVWAEKLLNRKVFLAYLIFVGVFFVNLYAFRGVEFKYGGVIQSIGQIFVLVLSILFCREKAGRNRIVGNVLIICGVMLYSIR